MTAHIDTVLNIGRKLADDWAADFAAGARTISVATAAAPEHASDEVYAQRENDLVATYAALVVAGETLFDRHKIPTAIRTVLGGWMVTREEPRDTWRSDTRYVLNVPHEG